MKIIKEGNVPKQFQFECGICGCIFEVTRDECESTTGEVLSHECPCCGVNISIVVDADMCDSASKKEVKNDTTKEQDVPSVDCDFPISTELMKIIAPVIPGACFHGECWCRCPHCRSSFEANNAERFQRSVHNENVKFCPHCGYGFVL